MLDSVWVGGGPAALDRATPLGPDLWRHSSGEDCVVQAPLVDVRELRNRATQAPEEIPGWPSGARSFWSQTPPSSPRRCSSTRFLRCYSMIATCMTTTRAHPRSTSKRPSGRSRSNASPGDSVSRARASLGRDTLDIRAAVEDSSPGIGHFGAQSLKQRHSVRLSPKTAREDLRPREQLASLN